MNAEDLAEDLFDEMLVRAQDLSVPAYRSMLVRLAMRVDAELAATDTSLARLEKKPRD